MSPAQQRGLALWASLLSAMVCLLFLPVPRWGAWLILLVTLALIIGIWRIASRRTGRNVASTLAPLPEGAYRQPVVLVCGDLPFVWSQKSPVRVVKQGCWIRVEKTEELQQVARQVLSQRPEWGPQLSVLLCVCPQRHAQSDALTSALLALRWQLSQLRQQTGYAVPLALQGQVGSAMSRDLLWQAAIPGEAVKVWQPSCAPCSVPAWVSAGGASDEVDRRPLDGYFSALGFGEEDSLWPEDGRSFRGYQLLLEYFTFREKFMFIDLRGLETVAFPAGLAWFEIDVVLAERWEHDFRFSEKQLRLHCVPVINLFPLESDPLTINSLQTEYPLRPMRVQDGHTEIYTVDSVISSHQQVYAPFSSFRHKGGMMRHDAADYYYHTRVRHGPSGLYNTWLIVGGEAFDNHTVPEDESLSLTLTGTNGQLPRRALQSTVLDTVMKTTSASVAVRNLCAPTLPCYPPAQDRFHWRVLSHLGSSFLSLMDNAEVLRGTLALYEWTDSEMNRRRLEAILDVNHRATERFAQGHLVRGVQIEVTLDSHGFAGRGDICLFGEMLSRFFALYTDIYLFNRLIIILQPTGERLEWEEKHSRRIPG